MPNYSFGGIDFPTLKAVEIHAKAIKNRYPIGAYLNQDDFAFMLDLLGRHTEAEQKIGCGVMAIYMGDDKWGGKCFYLIRLDQSSTDFSYRHCISRQGNDPRSNFDTACRNAVSDQVKPYRAYGKHVHHDGMRFSQIVHDFIEDFEVDVRTVEFVRGDMVTETRFVNKLLEACWRDYHEMKATLVPMSEAEHKRVHRSQRNIP